MLYPASDMRSTIFHHWLDQFRALPKRRQRWIRGGLVALAFVVVLVLGFVAGRGLGLPNGLQARVRALTARNSLLQDQNQGLRQQQQTASTTLAALKKSLAGRDSELQTLKKQQAIYAKLIGIDGGHAGLGVHSLAVTPVPGTDAWNFEATLVNTAENADAARGTLTLAVEGVLGGKLVTADWPELAGAGSQDGVPFAFKFFQQVHGSFVLPKGFVPNRLAVTLHPKGGAAVTHRLAWKDALAGHHGITATTP